MFASFLAYQLIDFVIAVALVALAARALPAARIAWLVARFPRGLATPFRRLALVLAPAFCVAMVVAAIVGKLWVFRAFDQWARGHPQIQRAANVGTFFVLGVTYLGMFVVLPVLGLWRAWREPAADASAQARRRVDRRLAAAAAVAATGLVAYTAWCEPNRIVVEQRAVPLAAWPAGKPALRIVLFSDLQAARLGARERRVPELVAGLAPDLVLIAGDLVSGSFDESLPIEQARFVLSRLAAPLGVFAVNGDTDGAVEGGIRRVIEGTGVRLLDNESVLLASDPPVELCGFDPNDFPRFNQLLDRPPRAAIRIGLVHKPRYYEHLGRGGFPLVLAGHTHGGQVVVPGFGPPVTYETVPRAVAAGGLHLMENGVQLYVTRGVGVEGGFAPPIRFLCPPEISLLTLGPPD